MQEKKDSRIDVGAISCSSFGKYLSLLAHMERNNGKSHRKDLVPSSQSRTKEEWERKKDKAVDCASD